MRACTSTTEGTIKAISNKVDDAGAFLSYPSTLIKSDPSRSSQADWLLFFPPGPVARPVARPVPVPPPLPRPCEPKLTDEQLFCA